MTARILVVDDEPDLETLIQQKFRHQIRDGTVSFLFAHDGVEALATLAANQDVDLVVADINMPRMDGLTLLQKLQENEIKLSTIIVSAYGDMINIRTAMNRGAFDFLTKPIDFLDLETTIAKTIRHIEILRDTHRRQAAAERAHASLSRYFSPNLAAQLAGDADAMDLSGQRREIATLFSDITGFTTLVETIEPEALGPLLNDYLTGMTDLVFAHDGTVAKIIGDALHVLFGAPGDQPDHELIIDRVAALRLPAIYQWPDTAEEGGFVAYGPRFARLYELLAQQAAKLLHGIKVADIPVEQPTKFELVINLKTAKALGLTVPETLLARADKVIE
jgi:adenylate cyclase